MKITRTAGLFATSLAALTLAGGVALADEPSGTMTQTATASTATAPTAGPPSGPCISTNGSKACFAAYGDRLWILDTAKDGHHAAGRLVKNDGDTFYCHNYKGKGKWKSCAWPKHIPEHSSLTMYAMNMEGGDIVDTSSYKIVKTT